VGIAFQYNNSIIFSIWFFQETFGNLPPQANLILIGREHIGPPGFNDKPKFTTLKSEPHTTRGLLTLKSFDVWNVRYGKDEF
jgi:hypothetical protein